MRGLRTLTFVYVQREDRVMAAINAGEPDAWSCWLTRRLALAVLDRATEFLDAKSELAQRAPAELRGETIEFEREAGIAKTAAAMTKTPSPVLAQSATVAELATRLAISQLRGGFRVEFHGHDDAGAVALFRRAEMQRMLQMLQAEVTKADWQVAPARPQVAPLRAAVGPKPARH